MSRSNKIAILRNLGFLIGGAAAIFVGVAWVQELAKVDPFARKKELDAQPLGQRIAIRFNDVVLKQYRMEKLRTFAEIAQVDVLESRQEMNFYGIKKGQYFTDKGKFQFTADEANWNAVSQMLQVPKLARVQNDKVNLTTAGFFYDGRSELLNAPGDITGKFYGGDLKTTGFVYNLKEEAFRTGPASWEGVIANPLQEVTGGNQQRRWKFDTPKGSRLEKGIYTVDGGMATDGEVIVRATKIEHDQKSDVLTGTGKVYYFSGTANLVADKVVVYRKERRAVLTGNVDMLVKPEDRRQLEEIEIPPFRPIVPDEIAQHRPPPPVAQSSEDKKLDQEVRSGRNIRKYPVTVTAQKIEYWYARGSRRAVITGSPQALQELPGGRWRYVWATRATYDGEKERLRLLSAEGKKDVRMKNSRGEDLVAEWFDVSTKEEDEAWEAWGLIGTLMDDEDEIPRDKATGRAGGPPPPGLRGPIGGTRRL